MPTYASVVWFVVAPWVLRTTVAADASIEITLVVAKFEALPVTFTPLDVILNLPPTCARVEPPIVACGCM